MKTQRILVVDDERLMCELLSEMLSGAGYEVQTAEGVEEALSLLVNAHRVPIPFDFLLTDFNLPCLTGPDLIDTLREEGIELPSLLMSGDFDETLEMEARARGCVGCLRKPFDLSVLMGHLQETLGNNKTAKQLTG